MRPLSRLVPSAAFALAAALVGALLSPAAAIAAEGDRRVVSGVHADLVSVGLVNGQLTLGSTATVDGELEKELDPAATIFNLENAAHTTLGRGSGLPFLGDLGAEFWIAPQSNPDGALLWPGVSAESIGSGLLDNDDVAVSLSGVDGPGFLSIYQTDSFGVPIQLLDSRTDSGYSTWALKSGQHQHANWAFSASGEYAVTFTAAVTIGGVPQSLSQTYSIFVGNMEPAAATTISAPRASADTLTAGSEITLEATVTPSTATGSVSFFTDTMNLGSADVSDGLAALSTSTLPLGRQTISARFEPLSADDFEQSVSSPTSVTVTPSRSSDSLGIAPLAASYTDGESVTFTAIGDPLAEGENYQWVMRTIGTETWEMLYDGFTYVSETAPTLTRELTTDYNGYEIGLQIQRSFVVTAESTPVAISVTGPSVGTGLDVRVSGIKTPFEYGEYAELTATGAALPEGAHYEWFNYYPRTNNSYLPTDLGDPDHVVTKTFYVPEYSVLPLGVRIVGPEGDVLGTSPRYTLESENPPQLELEGIKTFYHPGDDISLTATISPVDSKFDTYEWALYSASGETTIIEGATGPTVTLPATLDLNKSTISAVLVEPTRGDERFGYAGAEIIVLDPDAADQIYFNPLARHYHSGDKVNLHLVSSSASSDDTYRWYMQRADQADYVQIPDATGPDYQLTAEVALASTRVKAELVGAGGEILARAEPASIIVDDHGSPPPRHLALSSDKTGYTADETATFTAVASPASVLDRYEWWVQKSTEGIPALLGQSRSGTFDISLDASFDGAHVSSRLTKETGETYIQSEAVTLSVAASTTPGDETPIGEVPPTPVPGGDSPSPIVWDVPNLTRTDSGAVILNNGHVDLASTIENDVLKTQVKDTTASSNAIYRETINTVFQLKPNARKNLPNSDTYDFLGEPGAPVWQASQTQESGILWPGWSTELIRSDATQGGVEWSLTDISGPGEFALYESSATELGAVDVIFNSRDGVDDADSYVIPKNTHAHGTWSFTAEGVYCIAFNRAAVLSSNTAVSDDFVVTVAVGQVNVTDVDPSECFAAPEGEPTVVDSTPIPDTALVGASSGGIEISNGGNGFQPGQLITAQVGRDRAGEWVSAWVHSNATWMGWKQVSSAGEIQVRLPADTTVGDHKLVVKDRAGELVGWDSFTVKAAPLPGSGEDGDGDGDNGEGGEVETPGTPAPGGAAPVPPSQTVAATQCVAGATILSSGHIDYGSRIINGKLESLIKDGTTQSTVWREPSSTVLWLKPSSKLSLPTGYGAVGAAGSTVYQVPQTQNPNLVWLGWNTESINTGQASSAVTWTLNSVKGPGSVHVYTQGSFGGVDQMVFANRGSYNIELGKHVHGNWAFSAEGTYRLNFTQSVTLANGQTSSDTETLTIAVGDVDPKGAITSAAGCGAVSNSVLLAADIAAADAEAAAATAAAAAQADAAKTAEVAAEAESQKDSSDARQRSSNDGATVNPFSALSEGNPVPILLYGLGGLLVVGAVTGGFLWRRQRRWENTATLSDNVTE
jgi:putative ABC transporter-associated repeat protein